MGAFHMDLRERRIAQVVTLDALFSLVHTGLVRALAQDGGLVDLAPEEVQTFADKLAAELAAEEDGALANLVEGYPSSKSIVAVARVLTGSTIEDAELAKIAGDEKSARSRRTRQWR